MKEIAFDTLTMMPKDSFVLIDIRDEGLTSYGMIPGAVNIPVDKTGRRKQSADCGYIEGKETGILLPDRTQIQRTGQSCMH